MEESVPLERRAQIPVGAVVDFSCVVFGRPVGSSKDGWKACAEHKKLGSSVNCAWDAMHCVLMNGRSGEEGIIEEMTNSGNG